MGAQIQILFSSVQNNDISLVAVAKVLSIYSSKILKNLEN